MPRSGRSSGSHHHQADPQPHIRTNPLAVDQMRSPLHRAIMPSGGGSLSSADSSSLLHFGPGSASHATSPLLSEGTGSPAHVPLSMRAQRANIASGKKNAVHAETVLQDLDQPLYQEPFQNERVSGARAGSPTSPGDSPGSSGGSSRLTNNTGSRATIQLVKKGSVLDNGGGSGRHASLMRGGATTAGAPDASNTLQLREGGSGSLAGHKVNYLDSGYSEEDPDQQVTSCLMKTASGSIYIPGNIPKNLTMDSRLEYRLNQSPPSCHSPAKDSYKTGSERTTNTNHSLHYANGPSDVHAPFLAGSSQGSKRQYHGDGAAGGVAAASAFHKSKFGLAKGMRNCSWRCLAIFFVVIAFILAAALAYVTASNIIPSAYESAKACAVVVDDDQDQLALSHMNQAATTDLPADSSMQHPQPPTTSHVPRNLPPDSTSFHQIALSSSQRHSQVIPAYGYWNVQFYQSDAAYVDLQLQVPRGASIGLYARRNALPTHTNYDMMEVVKGFVDYAVVKRAIKRSVDKQLALYLEEGHWFVSFYNDYGDSQRVELLASPSPELTEGCPNGCSGQNGECTNGKCVCKVGFGGEDCSQGVCPLLCNGHGDYNNGECQCHPGWKGKECSLRHEECEVSDCNGHGHCVDGECKCIGGFTGEFCEIVDCPDPSCSGHGFCVEGACVCKKGWKGESCGDLDEDARLCLPDCGGRGTFDLETGQCKCKPGWTGDNCSARMCNLDCGEHGRCENKSCVCDPGWSGATCSMRTCDPRCAMHGQCKNGTCLCVTGWNGRHCTLEGCPSQCSGHGSCRMANEANKEWACQCRSGWEGPGCNLKVETQCSDGLDNDEDGLVDCEDPECCSQSSSCGSSALCLTAPRPIDILLQRQPPAPTASFYQKMRFIIEEGSLQKYVKNTAFNESRSAVIRGRVVTPSGRGLVGVRVSRESQHHEGFTMTQEDGWFDFMVNGGGAVMLKFGKSPYPAQTRALFVPWNEVVVIDPVVMSMNKDSRDLLPLDPHFSPCVSHDYERIKPIVLASWRLAQESASSLDKESEIISESRVLQEVLPLPSSDIKLVYHSSRARGYLSTIELRLTPSEVPPSLRRVLLRITIEGDLFEKTFEADPNLKYTFAWERLNIYRQRVYGTTTAVVKVGYEYTNCERIIWDVQTTKILGQDLTASNVGGWDFHIHHRYNYQEGILYKGDGDTVFLKDRPRIMAKLIGEQGKSRKADGCKSAEKCFKGEATRQRLLSPVAIAAAADGSVYVGDYDLIRRVYPDGRVITVLKLTSAGIGSYRYHMAVHPRDETLYISDPEAHQIIRLRSVNNPTDLEHNYDVVVGSGARCLPGDDSQCGDGGLARDARLVYPKGLAVSAEGRIYFADGASIRMVDEDRIITTLVGKSSAGAHSAAWKPLSCSGSLTLEEAVLRWPSELAINPLDDSLHFVDDNLVMRVTSDRRLQIVAGRPLHCARKQDDNAAGAANELSYLQFASQTTLSSPQSISFSPNGHLYIAESDSRRINRISVVDTHGRLSLFAGKESKCNCQESDCLCYAKDARLASESLFGGISGIAAGGNAHVYIADQVNRLVQVVQTSIPSLNEDQQYQVFSPESGQVFLFNRFGLHMETRAISNNALQFRFSYSVTTSNGKLTGISDARGNKIKVVRDYAGRVSAIENGLNEHIRLRMDRKGLLTVLRSASNVTYSYTYHKSSELLASKRDSKGQLFVFDYDANGRLSEAVAPTGDTFWLRSDLELRGAVVNVSRNGLDFLSLLIQPRYVESTIGAAEREVLRMQPDGGFVSNSKWGSRFSLDTSPYQLIQDSDDDASNFFQLASSERTDIGRDTVNLFEWQYFSKASNGGAESTIGKRLKVNGETILTVEGPRESQSEVVTLEKSQSRINVSDSESSGLRISMLPSGLFAPVNLERNRLGQPTLWQWGERRLSFKYDLKNRLEEVKQAGKRWMTLSYNDQASSRPARLVIASGGTFVLQRDQQQALKSIQTPRGHLHGLSVKHVLGFNRLCYQAPWTRLPFELHLDAFGQLAAKVYPGVGEKTVYVYNHPGQLKSILGGSSSLHFHYYPTSGLVKAFELLEDDIKGYEMKGSVKYHQGQLKEKRVTFNALDQTQLDPVTIRYQYDGSARISGITTTIGRSKGDQEEERVDLVQYKYNSVTGQLEAMGDLKVRSESARRSVIEDVKGRTLSRSVELDKYGRLSRVSMRLRGAQVFSLGLKYNSLNLVIEARLGLEGQVEAKSSYAYNANDQLETVEGPNPQTSWAYTYDVNGNVLSMATGSGQKLNLGYDGGDRVIAYGDKDAYVTYDSRGRIIRRGEQRYAYNFLDQMTTAAEPGRFVVRFFYDERGNLAAKRDHMGNVVQFVYADESRPTKVTHVHYPKADRTYRLFYDSAGSLLFMETPDSRYYIGCDHLGSPLAVFDASGSLVREINRTPFGLTVKDTNPAMDVPIGFAGGLTDQYTLLVHFEGGRIYDPVLGQWMAPNWERVASHQINSPFDVFAYRFRNNNPLLRPDEQRSRNTMTGLDSWLEAFQLDTAHLMGSSYVKGKVLEGSPWNLAASRHELDPDRNKAIEISVGLQTKLKSALNNMKTPGLQSPSDRVLASSTNPVAADLIVGHVASEPGPFGGGLLLSDMNGQALVHSVPASRLNDVAQSVFLSVLNSTTVLDVCHGGGEDYFFLKDESDERATFADDLEELQRLSGSYNISSENIRPRGRQLCAKSKSRGHELVCLIYGVERRLAERHVLRQAHKFAARAAWAREADLVKQGRQLQLSNAWSSSQKAELVKTGEVRGFVAVEVVSSHKVPALIGQSSNIKFVRDSDVAKWRTTKGA